MKRILLLSLPLVAIACNRQDVVGAVAPEAATTAHGGVVDHVLLVSVDGLHAVDLERFVAAHPASTLARMAAHGVVYDNAHTPSPSDSFPGLLAMVTGGTPASTGVYYDNAYDRRLAAPGSDCSTRGTDVVLDESIDVDSTVLDAGGGIDPEKLPRDPDAGCTPVYPHQRLRVNTIFEVVHEWGGTTAWSDKHPAYDLVNGPSGEGVDDLYTPEIAADDITGSVALTEAYDDGKVAHVVELIEDGAPTLFGLNFQAVSVAQKLAGYADAAGTPGAAVADALAHTDASLGKLVAALEAAGLSRRTVVIVSAKHGQSPIDPAARRIVDSKLLTHAVDAVAPGLLAHATLDDVALLWLRDAARAADVVAALDAERDAAAIDAIYSGAALDLWFGPLDERRPDIVVLPRHGVIWTKPSATKVAEHGGFGEDDTHVALVVANPRWQASTVRTPVTTMSIAPTILQLLRIPGDTLAAVGIEGTPTLPDLR